MKVSVSSLASESEWQIVSEHRGNQPYTSRRWNFEEALRLVISGSKGTLETSLYRHFVDGRYLKTVIELPTSYGCQVGCGHCASGMIGTRRNLSAIDLDAIYRMTLARCEGEELAQHNVSFAGIGECSLNAGNILAFCRTIEGHKIDFSFTTVGIRPAFIEEIYRNSREIRIKVLQISLLHHSTLLLCQRIGRGFVKFNLEDIVEQCTHTPGLRTRLNYVLMSDFNDSDECVREIAETIKPLRELTTIRVSLLNETPVSKMNNLLPTDRKKVFYVSEYFKSLGFDSYAFMSEHNDEMNCGQLIWRGYR